MGLNPQRVSLVSLNNFPDTATSNDAEASENYFYGKLLFEFINHIL